VAVRIIRGRAADPAADREVTRGALSRTAATGRPAVRAWVPHRQVAFGARDARTPGYERARRTARRRGYAAVERTVGGRAAAYPGRTVAFAHAVPLDDPRAGLRDRYDDAVATVVGTLRRLGARVEPGEPPSSFCPGEHSVAAVDGGKVAGVAQRVTGGGALVAGCVVVADRVRQRAVLRPVYRALGVPFDPGSVGDVATAGGPDDADRVARALEAALVDGREGRVTFAG
jgi:lipoate-protein ligase A